MQKNVSKQGDGSLTVFYEKVFCIIRRSETETKRVARDDVRPGVTLNRALFYLAKQCVYSTCHKRII